MLQFLFPFIVLLLMAMMLTAKLSELNFYYLKPRALL